VTGAVDRNAWTEPGVETVAPGVHRMPLPLPNDGLKAVNIYVLEGDDGLTLIDAGWAIPQARELLESGLGSLGLSLGDIRRFLVTHVHRDHYTQAIAVRREFGTRVSLGIGERESLEVIMDPSRMPLHPQIDSMRAMGAGELADMLEAHTSRHRERRSGHGEWERPDDWLDAGVVETGGNRSLEVVPTPGHTRGHVVFHDMAASLLFAGDHVLPTITPSIGFEQVLSANPLGDFLESLAVVRSRPDARLLPAHGMVTDSVHARVDELVAFHGARLDETEHAVRTGGTTAYDVAGQLKWTRREKALSELDPFNQMLAIAETAAHLVLLVAQGRLGVIKEDGVRRYVLPGS
jgi:glyoxylase-like metal-dependent hydrolase (beta-lactamase superfamily II)